MKFKPNWWFWEASNITFPVHFLSNIFLTVSGTIYGFIVNIPSALSLFVNKTI